MSIPGEGEAVASGRPGVPRPVRGGIVWFALLGGLTIWFVRLVVASALVDLACRTSLAWLWATSLVGLAGAALAVAASVVLIRRRDQDLRGLTFVGFTALPLNVFGVALIAFESIALLVVHPCR